MSFEKIKETKVEVKKPEPKKEIKEVKKDESVLILTFPETR